MSGPFDFIHLKGQKSNGSPNELSFDVLDAAKSDKKTMKRGQQAPTAPKPSQGTYHGVSDSSTLSAIPEVERRKKVRRNRSMRIGVLVAVLAVVVLGAAGYFGYKFYQEKVDFNGHYHSIIDRLVTIDQTLVEIDSLMKDPLNADQASNREKMLDAEPRLVRELNEIHAEIEQMKDDARGDADLAALSSALSATDARQSMVKSAEEAFTRSNHANTQMDKAMTAWSKVLEADKAAREATLTANDAANESQVKAARELTEKAVTLLKEAKEGLQTVAGETGANYKSEITYIDKRIEALEYALKTSDAILKNDRAAAMANNSSYNAADAEAAELAVELKTSPASKVMLAYENEMLSVVEDYGEARQAAATADSAIRAYL